MEKTEHDLARLPLWARHRIQKLEFDPASLGKRIDAMTGGTKTRIQIDPYHGESAVLPSTRHKRPVAFAPSVVCGGT